MKTFCEFLREHAMKIINFGKKKIKLLTKEQQESYKNVKICYIYKEKFGNKHIIKLEIIAIIQESIEVLLCIYSLKFKI